MTRRRPFVFKANRDSQSAIGATMSDNNKPNTIHWPSILTVISAAILIGAEVFGAAFAGGWAFGILLGLSDNATYILQAVLMCLGVVVMTIFIRNAQRIEPFWSRKR
jgi:hypothetical protein